MKNNISHILESEKAEHSRRLNFLTMLEKVQEEADSFGFHITVSKRGKSNWPSPASNPEDFSGDSMRFKSISDSVDWALKQVSGEFSSNQIRDLVRGAAPRFFASRHNAGFNLILIKKTGTGELKVTYRGGSGNGPSRFIKTNSHNVVTQD